MEVEVTPVVDAAGAVAAVEAAEEAAAEAEVPCLNSETYTSRQSRRSRTSDLGHNTPPPPPAVVPMHPNNMKRLSNFSIIGDVLILTFLTPF